MAVPSVLLPSLNSFKVISGEPKRNNKQVIHILVQHSRPNVIHTKRGLGNFLTPLRTEKSVDFAKKAVMKYNELKEPFVLVICGYAICMNEDISKKGYVCR